MEKNKKPYKNLQVRFPDETLLERLKRLAKDDNRSLNGEILQALLEFVEQKEQTHLRGKAD